jgi:hypothetical protein
MFVKEEQSKPRRNILFEHAEFHPSQLRFYQWSAMRSVRLAFQMIVMPCPMFVGVGRMLMAVFGGVMLMVMRVRVGMRFSIMAVLMSMFMFVAIAMVVLVGQVNVEFRPGNGSTFPATNVEVIAVEPELAQFALESAHIQAQVDHRAQEHVAADAAEDIQVKSFHALAASALIWLAA